MSIRCGVVTQMLWISANLRFSLFQLRDSDGMLWRSHCSGAYAARRIARMEEAMGLRKKLTADDLRRMAGRAHEAERERKLLFLAEKLEDAARRAEASQNLKH